MKSHGKEAQEFENLEETRDNQKEFGRTSLHKNTTTLGIYYLRGDLKKINWTIRTWCTELLVLITPNNLLARPKESWAKESKSVRNSVKLIYLEYAFLE